MVRFYSCNSSLYWIIWHALHFVSAFSAWMDLQCFNDTKPWIASPSTSKSGWMLSQMVRVQAYFFLVLVEQKYTKSIRHVSSLSSVGSCLKTFRPHLTLANESLETLFQVVPTFFLKKIEGPRLARGPWHMRTRSRSPGPIPPHPKAGSPVVPVIRPAASAVAGSANPYWRLANPPIPAVPPPNGRQVLPFGLQRCSKERAVGWSMVRIWLEME